jgi:hypothetical protein
MDRATWPILLDAKESALRLVLDLESLFLNVLMSNLRVDDSWKSFPVPLMSVFVQFFSILGYLEFQITWNEFILLKKLFD